MIPSAPSESISAMMFGSISVSRIRFQSDISTSSISAPAVSSTKPFGTVFVAVEPARAARAASARRRRSRPARAPRAAVRFDALRTAASAQSPLRPCSSRERAQRGGGVVHDLAPQVLLDVLAADADRRRGADVRLRRHREHVRGLADPDAGRCRARALGRDVDDHRDLRRELALVDLRASTSESPPGVSSRITTASKLLVVRAVDLLR